MSVHLSSDKEKPEFVTKLKYPKPNFRLLFIYSGKFEYALLSIGFIAIMIYRLMPLFLVLQIGDLIEVMQENQGDADKFYREEQKVATSMFVLGGIALISGWIAVASFLKVGKNISLKWRSEYFCSVINRPMKWYDKNNPSELSTSIDMDIDAIESGVGLKMLLLISAMLGYFSIFIFSAFINLQLTLIALVPIPIQFLSGLKYEKITLNAAIESQEKYKTAGGIAEESFEGIKTIASCNAQEQRALAYQTELEPLKASKTKIGIYQGFFYAVSTLILFVLSGVIYYAGSVFVDDKTENWGHGEEITARDVVVVAFTFAITAFCSGIFMPFVKTVSDAKIAAWRVYGIILKNKKYDGDKKVKKIRGEVEFENVGFSYPTREDVRILNGVSFKVERGEVLAVVGQTGSGKSTIMQLIEGFYYCDQGFVRIDGVDIKEYDISSLRNFIGLVSQEPVLFSTTIRENIQIGKLTANEQDIKDAAVEAEANFIEELEDKYETYVGIKGSQLSGGQKQRIAIARALIKKPKIFLLDEATSALDVNTEKKIQITLDKISKSRTTIIVAQRLSSIRNANQIIVISEGKVIESGNHQSLMELNGNYAKFHAIQNDTEDESKSCTESVIIDIKSELSESEFKEIKGKVFKSILRMLFSYWPLLLLAIASAIISGILYPIQGYLVADNTIAIIEESGSELTSTTEANMYYSFIEAGIIFFSLIVLFGSLARISALITDDIRYKGISSILYYDQKFFDKPTSSPAILSYTFSTDCEKISGIGGPVLIFQLLTMSGIIGGIIIALVHDTIYSLFVIASFIVMIWINATGDALKSSYTNTPKEITQITYDSLTNIKTVHSLDRQNYFLEKYVNSCKMWNNLTLRNYFWEGFHFGLKYAILYIVWGVATWYGAYRVSKGDLSADEMTIVFFTILFSTYGSIVLSNMPQDVDEGIKSAIKVNKMIGYIPEINANSSSGSKEKIAGNLTFSDVCFKYEERENIVLRNITFEVEAGKSLGITGVTGSGKSTIAQLLLRFYDVISGEIKIDGILIKSFNIKYLRESICWVGQEPILFKGSLLHNLKIVNELITSQEAIEAINKAQGADIIERYGLNNDVGLRGNKLSGGQKQRIAIARALVRRPKILVLDESTSALDSITESNLLDILKEEKFTIISIAHRLRTIRNCDEIIVLDKGLIIEKGTHEDLIENTSGNYYQLSQISDTFN